MSFRTGDEIEVTFEDCGTSGTRYHVGAYHSMHYPNRDQAAKSAASRFPKLTIGGRLMADIIPAAKDVEAAPRPVSPVVEAEIAIGEASKVCAVTEKKKRKAVATKATKKSAETPSMLW